MIDNRGLIYYRLLADIYIMKVILLSRDVNSNGYIGWMDGDE
jgi:hypothetical protein